jgi:hypothetical protein
MNRRQTVLALAAFAAGVGTRLAGAAAPVAIEVWKSPTCGCCGEWVKHIEAAGLRATVRDTGNNAARARLGIPVALGSCHTAEVAGYAIEGHVPAREIRRLLAERPDARGLAVPGMPIGSPGMEQGSRRDAYDVLLVRKDGTTAVFAAYAAQ